MPGISLTRAKRIISATFAKGKEMGLQPLAAVVLDAGGHPIAFERQDGAPCGRFNIADGKANAAVQMGVPSSILMARAAQNPNFAISIGGVYGDRFTALAGGILIRDKRGNLLGAVGVTGDTSDNDVVAGVAGVEAAGLVPQG